MNFMEAVKAMEEGKKVMRPNYGKDNFMCENDGYFYWNGGGASSRVVMALVSIEATDWEIYEEEKKTLSDKIINPEVSVNAECVLKKHIEKSIKDYREKIKLLLRDETDLCSKAEERTAKEIFGNRLIENDKGDKNE